MFFLQRWQICCSEDSFRRAGPVAVYNNEGLLGSSHEYLERTLQETSFTESVVDWRALRSRDWQTRRDAVSRLAFCGCKADGEVSPEVLSALRCALEDENWQVRERSQSVLAELSHTSEHVARLRKTCVFEPGDERVQDVWASRSPEPAFPKFNLGKAADQTLKKFSLCTGAQSCACNEKEMSECAQRCQKGDEGDPYPESSMECVGIADVGEISIHVSRTPGTKFGIKVDAGCDGALKVLRVHSGIISDWNKSQPPWRQLRPGDCVTAVNGQRGDANSLIRALTSEDGESFELTFERIEMHSDRHSLHADEHSQADDAGMAGIQNQVSAFQTTTPEGDSHYAELYAPYAEFLVSPTAGGTNTGFDQGLLTAGGTHAGVNSDSSSVPRTVNSWTQGEYSETSWSTVHLLQPRGAVWDESESSRCRVAWNDESFIEKLNKRVNSLSLSLKIVPMRTSV